MAQANNGPVRHAFIDDLFNVPEFLVLCLVARWPLGFEDATALHGAAAEVTNWETVVGGARRHRVTSLVLSALQASGCPHVPVEVIAELRRQSLAAGVRNLAQVGECGRLTRIFAAAGIRVLVLKGVAPSIQLYRELARNRRHRSLDGSRAILGCGNAETTLTDAGYQHSLGVLPTSKRHLSALDQRDQIFQCHHRRKRGAAPPPRTGEFDAMWSDHERCASARPRSLRLRDIAWRFISAPMAPAIAVSACVGSRIWRRCCANRRM
jgi:hypothetical protein